MREINYLEGIIMIETILKIDGMACGMCESHINDVVRRTCDVKKVTSCAAPADLL